MYLGCSSKSGSAEYIQAYHVVVEGLFLSFVVFLNKVVDSSLEALLGDQLAVALRDRGAVAVRAGYENYIFVAQPVAQESCVYVGKYEHAADVPEVQLLISVGHSSGDYSALGELRTGCLVLYKFLFLFAHCVSFLSCEGYPFPFHRPPSKALCERRRALCISHRFSGVFRILSGFICNLYDTT